MGDLSEAKRADKNSGHKLATALGDRLKAFWLQERIMRAPMRPKIPNCELKIVEMEMVLGALL